MTRLELCGALLIITLGSLLHFAYEAANEAWWVGIFSATSESVWEHLKLVFWPGLLWTLFLWLGPINRPRNFWLGRAASLAMMPLIIALGYYGYTALLGGHFLVLDLALFVLSIACGQATAMAIYRAASLGGRVEAIAITLILLLVTAFSTVSFIRPNFPLFEDPSRQGSQFSALRSDRLSEWGQKRKLAFG
jgi:hypothetical protein